MKILAWDLVKTFMFGIHLEILMFDWTSFFRIFLLL
jgi:hypothetical protein